MNFAVVGRDHIEEHVASDLANGIKTAIHKASNNTSGSFAKMYTVEQQTIKVAPGKYYRVTSLTWLTLD